MSKELEIYNALKKKIDELHDAFEDKVFNLEYELDEAWMALSKDEKDAVGDEWDPNATMEYDGGDAEAMGYGTDDPDRGAK